MLQSRPGTPLCLVPGGAWDGSTPPGEQSALQFPPPTPNQRNHSQPQWAHSPAQGLVGRLLHAVELLTEAAGRAPAGQLRGRFLNITGGLEPGWDRGGELGPLPPHTWATLCRAGDPRTRHLHCPAYPPPWSRCTAGGGDNGGEAQAAASEPPNKGPRLSCLHGTDRARRDRVLWSLWRLEIPKVSGGPFSVRRHL